MFMDHIGYCIFGRISFLNGIGRIAFPIFAFQIAEGYSHTKDITKYLTRLIIFALVSQIPFMLFEYYVVGTSPFSLNVLFTLLLGLLAIYQYDKTSHKRLSLLLVALLAVIAQICKMDYGAFGVLIIFCFYVFKESKLRMTICYLVLVFLKYLKILLLTNFHIGYLILCFSTMLPILLICFYNGKQGKKAKYIFYLFYPIHLLLIVTIRILFFPIIPIG